jgi:uncharacterized protein YbgA (DUF1722 family)/uncharacterized protein YbbK (DUF523 family)
MSKIQIGISSCLLGQEVRHDGGHKRNAYILNTLSSYFEFRPLCPEMAIGMSVPRPPVRLVKHNGEIRLVGSRDPSLDVTEDMNRFASRTVGNLDDISAYILKKDSPSCGMTRVRIYNDKGHPEKNGSGLFASRLMEAHPCLPVEEEGRLMDPVLRENFLERVFVYYRWQKLRAEGLSVRGLMDFHACHKFNLLAHNESIYRELGPLVATANTDNLDEIAEQYLKLLMQGMKKPATRKRHTNVLMHVMGFLKDVLSSDDKQELLDILDQYRQGLVPLIVPITLLRHHLRKAPQPYIERQFYMNPYPEELMLRNNL